MGLIHSLLSRFRIAAGISLPDISELVREHQKQLEATMLGLNFRVAEDPDYGCRVATEKFDVIIYWLQRESWIVSDIEINLDQLPPYVLHSRHSTVSWLSSRSIEVPPYPPIQPNLHPSTLLCEELGRVRLAITSALSDDQTVWESLNFLEGSTRGYTDRVSAPPESQPDVVRIWARNRLKSMGMDLRQD